MPLLGGAAAQAQNYSAPQSGGAAVPTIATCPNGSGGYSPCPAASFSYSAATVTRPNNTTAYTGNQLIAGNTSGSATPAQLTVSSLPGGWAYIVHARAQSSYAGASAPPAQTWYLFGASPVTTNLVDGSAYVAPYAADITGGAYLGSLTCSGWTKTNDSTAQWWSPCSTSNLVTGPLPVRAVSGQTYIYVLVATGSGGYTPAANEVETLQVTLSSP